MTETKILTLIEQGSDVVFKQNNIKGNFLLKNPEQVAMIKLFESGELAEYVTFETSALSYKVGNSIDFTLALNSSLGYYASYQSYIEQSLISQVVTDTLIVYEDKKEDRSLLPALEVIFNFINCLKEHYYYRNNQVIIFAKTYCEIPIQVRSHEKYLELAKLYQDTNEITEAAKKLTNWLNADIGNVDDEVKKSLLVHETERNTIVAVELLEVLSNQDKELRVFFLLRDIESIYQAILSRYSLYLENFKFSKFNDKITERAEDFLEKTNDIIVSLQNQILAIPIAIAMISITKTNPAIDSFLVASFLIYAVMVLYATLQQMYNLWHLRRQINSFVSDNKIPKALDKRWKKEVSPIKYKMISHALYLVLVALLLIFIIANCSSYFYCWNSHYLVNILTTALSAPNLN